MKVSPLIEIEEIGGGRYTKAFVTGDLIATLNQNGSGLRLLVSESGMSETALDELRKEIKSVRREDENVPVIVTLHSDGDGKVIVNSTVVPIEDELEVNKGAILQVNMRP